MLGRSFIRTLSSIQPGVNTKYNLTTPIINLPVPHANNYSSETDMRRRRVSNAHGIWPVMLTPFTSSKQSPSKLEIDYESLQVLTEWYINNGANGLFAICLSSEMFHLDDSEKLKIASTVMKTVNGRIPVIAGATFHKDTDQQIDFINAMGDIVDAAIIITNQLNTNDFDNNNSIDSSNNSTDSKWLDRLINIMMKTRDIPLGFYETPLPKSLFINPQHFPSILESGRFVFYKNTPSNFAQTESILKLLPSDKKTMCICTARLPFLTKFQTRGGNGYCGIGLNYFPALISWMVSNMDHPMSVEVQRFLSTVAPLFQYKYPLSSKIFLNTFYNLPLLPVTRSQINVELTEEDLQSFRSLFEFATELYDKLNIKFIQL